MDDAVAPLDQILDGGPVFQAAMDDLLAVAGRAQTLAGANPPPTAAAPLVRIIGAFTYIREWM